MSNRWMINVPIFCPLLSRLFSGMITLKLDSLKMNRGHAYSLVLRHHLSEFGNPPPHNLCMLLRPVAGNTHSHTHTPRCKCGLRRAKGWRLCASGLVSRCESPAAISDQSRDVQALAGGVSQSATASGPSGGRKRKGETPTGGWYSFYGKSPKPTGPRGGRAVLQLHPALNLLNIRPVRAGV